MDRSAKSTARWLATVLGAALLFLLPAWSQASAASCDGKHATIVGTPGNDTIVGKKASDVIYGGGGDDKISGGPNGNDTICGGPGEDVIHGGRGNDTLDGEGGADRVYGGRGNDDLSGGGGDDMVDGGLGDDSLNGDGGTDRLLGSHGRDDISGGEGDEDVLRGDIGFDKLDGGPGARDIASFATASEAVEVDLSGGRAYGDGRDRIAADTEDVVGSAYGDTLIGDDADNRLDGGAGYDELDGRGGSDALYAGPDGASCENAGLSEGCGRTLGAGAGPTVASVQSIDGSGSLSVHGYSVDDSVTISFENGAFLVSDEGHPFPTGNVGGCTPSGDGAALCPADVQTIQIDVDGGNDYVAVDDSIPAGIEVRIDGGPGADDLHGGPGGDVIEAGDDSDPDMLQGGDGDDALIGARTDFHVPVNSGKSTLIGGAGSDVLVGGDPCDGDVFDGGAGNDNANFFRFTPGVSAEIGGPVRRAGSPCAPGHIDRSVEQLEGSPGPDTLIGSHRDSLIGHGGHNRLRLRR